MSGIYFHTSKHGVRKEFQNVEFELWKWVLNEKDRTGRLPKRINIQDYALKLYKEAGHQDFKASLGWYRRWKKRYDLKRNKNEIAGRKPESSRISDINLNLVKSETRVDSSDICLPIHNNNGGLCLGETLENFSLETDKLINNIDMINSPFEFFNFSDSFDKSMDSIDVHDSMKCSESSNTIMNNFIKELMDDFGKFFSDGTKSKFNTSKLYKKSCKYDKDFKKEVVRFIRENRIAEAASKFKIHPDTISIWLKDDKFQKQFSEIFVENSAKKFSNNDVVIKEKEFIYWLRDCEKNNVILTKCEVEKKIADMYTSTWSEQSHWFAKYCCRYLKGKQLKTIKVNYPDPFQKLIVNYANKTSQVKAASVFNLARKQLFNWMNNVHAKRVVCKRQLEDKLLHWYDSCTLKPTGNVIRNTAKKLYGEDNDVHCSYSWYYKWCAKHGIIVKRNCDEEIVEWILTSYDQNLSVSHQDIQKRALEIYQKRNEGNFKASYGWLLRFCRRYMNLLRRIPPLNISLPSSCETNVTHFRENILHLQSKYKIEEDAFGVMDEIPLKLKPSGIMNKLNQKKPLLRSCGLENVQGTVILTCLSNGIILPPIITLKEKNSTNTSTRYHVLYKSNEVGDDNIILFWLDKIWFRYVKQPNLLLLDCFSPHCSEQVKQKFIDTRSHLEIIPGGCSSKLNPLTQIVSPQFEDAIDENCKKWFDENIYPWQIEGSGSSLSSEDILDWVAKAYQNINTASTERTVRNIFEGMKLLPIEMSSSK